jgi:hypothetical protein
MTTTMTTADAHHTLSQMLLGLCYRRSFELAFGNDNVPLSISRKQQRCNLYGLMQDLLRGVLVGLGWPAGGLPTAVRRQDGRRVAMPLLGYGCRAFPKGVALDIVVLEAASWLLLGRSNGNDLNVGRRVGSANKDSARLWEQGFGNGDWMALQR